MGHHNVAISGWARAAVISVCVLAGSCMTASSSDTASTGASTEPPTAVPPASTPSDTATPESSAITVTPEASEPEASEPEDPAGEPAPTATPEPPVDDSPPVIEHLGWVITENRVDEITSFVEDSHDLVFTGPVGVTTSRDIGAVLGAGFEPFPEDDWALLEALGIVGEVERDVVNQVRRDRIRGVCCDVVDDVLTVTVEPQATRLETELIIVHEFVHALHRQHPEVFPRSSRQFQSSEYPQPVTAVIEGVPQLVTEAWLQAADPAEAAIARAQWPVITPELELQTGRGAGLLLNFSYGVAPEVWGDRYADGGADLLLSLLERPPQNWEQVIFPEAWDTDEEPLRVRQPELDTDVDVVDSGSIGAGLLYATLVQDLGEDEALRTVRGWIGDTWVRWVDEPADERNCLSARVAFETAVQAEAFAAAIDAGPAVGTELQPTDVDEVTVVRFDTC